MALRGRHPKPIEKWVFAPPPKAMPGTPRELTSKLVDVLVNASNARPALSLALSHWPKLWEDAAEEWKPDLLKIQDASPRDAVELWVRTHMRNLDWSMKILGSRANNERDCMNRTAKAYETAARHLRFWGNDLKDRDAAVRAAVALDTLPPDDQNVIQGHKLEGKKKVLDIKPLAPDPEKISSETIAKFINQIPLGFVLIGRVRSHADECERVCLDIRQWLEDNSAKGGINLASRRVATLVALFFNDARRAAHKKGLPLEDMPRVAFADDDAHNPRNLYCATVKSALEVLGQSPDSWRYAAQEICKKKRDKT